LNYPEFFEQIEPIEMIEPLGELLGLKSPSLVYSYLDCVKLAGHSCPTVAGAYLITSCSLKTLYKDKTPTRGEIKVRVRDSKDAGTTGVVANVISYITGAKEEDGFKGINGNYARDKMLSFDNSIDEDVEFIRVDNSQSIRANYNLSKLILPPLNTEIFKKVSQKSASSDELEIFKKQWQERVRTILIEYGCKAIELKGEK
jgi:hypothetical protein